MGWEVADQTRTTITLNSSSKAVRRPQVGVLLGLEPVSVVLVGADMADRM